MLPISSVNKSGSIPIYTFMDPNNADFTYTFNASQTGAQGTQGSGVGYFGSTNIASPMYVCDPANKKNAFSSDFPNWLSTINAQIDLRAFYVECQGTTPATYYYKRLIPDQNEVLGTLSSYTGAPVAYTTEALYYAQSGYFVTVVMVQWSNVFACKSRKVIFYLILVFFDLLRSEQAHVRWYCMRDSSVYCVTLRSRHQRCVRR